MTRSSEIEKSLTKSPANEVRKAKGGKIKCLDCKKIFKSPDTVNIRLCAQCKINKRRRGMQQ